jgi:hypothetical protein
VLLISLWGAGIGITAKKARYISFDREREGFGILGRIAFGLRMRSFYPFAQRRP